ncbi:MAG TPA: hypothetical protein QF753_07185 [Victivallales bacterium]|nr:hypothetical protein [Victivallales bacterium]
MLKNTINLLHRIPAKAKFIITILILLIPDVIYAASYGRDIEKGISTAGGILYALIFFGCVAMGGLAGFKIGSGKGESAKYMIIGMVVASLSYAFCAFIFTSSGLGSVIIKPAGQWGA